MTGTLRICGSASAQPFFLLVVKFVGLILGLAGEAQAQAAVGAAVHRGEDDGGVGLAPPQGGELIQRPLGQRVGGGGDGQGDQRLIGVEPGVDGARWLTFTAWMGSMASREMRWCW